MVKENSSPMPMMRKKMTRQTKQDETIAPTAASRRNRDRSRRIWTHNYPSSCSLIHLIFISTSLLILRLQIQPNVSANADAHLRDDLSFRGPVPEDLRIPHWDLSGSAHRIPSAKDFIRLHHPYPLAYGGMFTNKPIHFDQWSVEIALRIHGGFSDVHHGHHNDSHLLDDDELIGKGGRGLAFWYTRTPNPTPVTASANTKQHIAVPPSLSVEPFPDPLDDSVSFFGGLTSFDGLAVVIDNQPSTPLTRRSDRKHWGPDDGGIGAEEWSVVSGVIDDGKGHHKWVEDRLRSDLDDDEEAEYLNHTIGDCQVALRNAVGMIWIKITHVADQLTVSLDLSPHTTLSGETRHYKRECFTASNVKLPKGYYMGLTGLASPSDEADNIDVYAIEVKEIKGRAHSEHEVTEHYKEEHVAADDLKLEGTASKPKDPGQLAYEAINTQKNWAESIRQMSQKLEALKQTTSSAQPDRTPAHTTDHTPSGNQNADHQLAAINTKLDTILHKLDNIPSTGHENSDNKLLGKILDLEEQSNRHEMFLSQQIEELRHLILNPPPKNFQENHHFKPLEHQHDEFFEAPSSSHSSEETTTPSSGSKPTAFSDYFEHERRERDKQEKKMSMLSFLGWTTGSIVLLFGGFRLIKMFMKSRKADQFGSDESSYFLSTHPTGQSNTAFSSTMDAFGFRQRNKKMI